MKSRLVPDFIIKNMGWTEEPVSVLFSQVTAQGRCKACFCKGFVQQHCFAMAGLTSLEPC